ncbi:MAG: hypothetical protein PHG05_01975 [Candidatus Nanoarchaeia archaeon]|nr:hypothetical protein [Candidatus Nanoarchaeia archaeon]
MSDSSELGEKVPYQIVVLVVLGIMIGSVVMVLHMAVNQDIKVDGFQADLLMKRLFYSSDCFAYEDYRAHIGVINMSNFNEERLNSCLITDNLVYAKIDSKEISNDLLAYKDQLNFCKLKDNCFFERKYVLVNGEGKILDLGVIMSE